MPELATEKFFNETIGEVHYSVVIKPVGQEIHSMLWDLMSNYNVDRAGRQGADVQIGRAKDTVLMNCIKADSLKIEGEVVKLRADYPLANAPKYTDLEYGKGFENAMIRHCIEVNPAIGLVDDAPYGMIFRPYLPEHLRDRVDPTASDGETPKDSRDTGQEKSATGEDTSTSGPTSSSARIPTLGSDQPSGPSGKANEGGGSGS